VVLPIVCD